MFISIAKKTIQISLYFTIMGLSFLFGQEQLRKCNLTLELIDSESNKSIPGLIQVVDSQNKPILIKELIDQSNRWYALPEKSEIIFPRERVVIKAISGLETEQTSLNLDLTGKTINTIKLPLKRFYNARTKDFYSGNTHLHLNKFTPEESDRYLVTVPKSNGLDIVFVSYLERAGIDSQYVSNKYTTPDLEILSKQGVLFGNGEEHRHNFGPYDEGYGHVMFLNIKKLLRPVSLGPGLMKSVSDGIPLQRGIDQARKDGATIVWCHNQFGFEDIPNWISGRLDAQNIFDGGSTGTYEDTFYKYLNIGIRTPFSAGTDWFIYDFSRVYVKLDSLLTIKSWLGALRSGKSFITNGPFLEFQIGESNIGDTIKLESARKLNIIGHGTGRLDFIGLELIHNEFHSNGHEKYLSQSTQRSQSSIFCRSTIASQYI
ncbi:MAG: CehA/McbA family metallohydrolase [Patescibacteria group bacterium]|nr:CehA/McbA family metallohydrolase [Patescibacteria group bacterium]